MMRLGSLVRLCPPGRPYTWHDDYSEKRAFEPLIPSGFFSLPNQALFNPISGCCMVDQKPLFPRALGQEKSQWLNLVF